MSKLAQRLSVSLVATFLSVGTLPIAAQTPQSVPSHHASAVQSPPRVPAMVAAANPLAVEAGMEILRKGGDAVDAAVAIQAMLGLVEPQSSGVGGGSFFLYYDAATGVVSALNGRERAPAGATPDMFLDAHGKPLPFFQAVRSGRSTGVPGTYALLSAAHAQLGSMPWKELFGPAIRSARNGFKVPGRLAGFLSESGPVPLTPQVRALFARPDGKPLQADDLFKNPAYAHTLERLATEGPRAIYSGEIAAGIVERTHEEPIPGSMTLQDLAGYRAEWAKALCGPFRQYTVCVPPPPSSGVSLLELLAMLDHTDIAMHGPADPRGWFDLAEGSRLMYADRDQYIGDPEFVHVPVKALLDPEYLRGRARLIGERAGPVPPPGTLPGAAVGRDASVESPGTSHFVVMDASGNVVSMTTTVESVFGSGRTVGGFVLNNQLTDFSFRPVDDSGRPLANAVAGGKRPRSSMAPIIVLDRDGRFVAAVGSPGGSSILEYNAKAVVGILAWGLSMQESINLPNIIAHGNEFSGEVAKFPAAVRDGLRDRGMELVPGRAEGSGLHGILRRPDGTYEGGADPRREGVVRSLPVASRSARRQ
jgi:gamma-glutamyltranspeptidase/glutathione hydrolase